MLKYYQTLLCVSKSTCPNFQVHTSITKECPERDIITLELRSCVLGKYNNIPRAERINVCIMKLTMDNLFLFNFAIFPPNKGRKNNLN